MLAACVRGGLEPQIVSAPPGRRRPRDLAGLRQAVLRDIEPREQLESGDEAAEVARRDGRARGQDLAVDAVARLRRGAEVREMDVARALLDGPRDDVIEQPDDERLLAQRSHQRGIRVLRVARGAEGDVGIIDIVGDRGEVARRDHDQLELPSRTSGGGGLQLIAETNRLGIRHGDDQTLRRAFEHRRAPRGADVGRQLAGQRGIRRGIEVAKLESPAHRFGAGDLARREPRTSDEDRLRSGRILARRIGPVLGADIPAVDQDVA